MGYIAVPATTDVICCYVAYLAKSLKFTSIKQYINIVRIMHLEWNLPNPLSNNYHVQSVLRGIRRDIGDRSKQKLPITPDILLKMLPHLDISQSPDANIWAVCLMLFYGMLRKASVLSVKHRMLYSVKSSTSQMLFSMQWELFSRSKTRRQFNSVNVH
jgi:hypothetical protein